MAVLKVAKLGNPILRQVARQVDLKELADQKSELQKFIDDMIDTMRQEGGSAWPLRRSIVPYKSWCWRLRIMRDILGRLPFP